MNNIGLAKVSQVVDAQRFVIRATAKGVIEDVVAYPIGNDDEPKIGEEVVLFQLETEFGYSYLYKKQRLLNRTKFEFGDNIITLTEDGINIKTKNGLDMVIQSDGDLDIISTGSTKIHAKGELLIESDTQIKFKSPIIEFPTGTVAPNPAGGPFNCIPNCPYVGSPHTGNILKS